MSVDTYTTLKHTAMTKAIRMFEAPKELLGTRLFKAAPEWADNVAIDVVYGARHIANFRHPDAESGIQAQKQVKTINVQLPILSEKKKLPARVLSALRTPGTEHTKWGQAKVGEELQDLKNLLLYTIEKARWDLLQTGKFEQTSGDFLFSIDFSIAATHTPTLSTPNMWSETATADPIGNIMTWKAILAQDSGKVARFGICSTTVMNYLLNSTAVKALMGDTVKDELVRNGAFGRLVGLDMIVYDGGYKPVGGSFTPYIGVDKFILWTGDAFPEYYGIPNDDDAPSPGFFSDSWKEKDPKSTWVKVCASPCPSGERVEELFCADVHT